MLDMYYIIISIGWQETFVRTRIRIYELLDQLATVIIIENIQTQTMFRTTRNHIVILTTAALIPLIRINIVSLKKKHAEIGVSAVKTDRLHFER